MEADVAGADVARDDAAVVPVEDVRAVAAADAGFAFGLYRSLRTSSGANLFFSPYSVAAALAMTFAGARGDTAEEMAVVLQLPFLGDRLHAARNRLDQRLVGRDDDDDGALRLHVANSLWGQAGYPFEQPFLDTLARHYGAAVHLADFVAAAEQARHEINQWVEVQTQDRIRDLIPEGLLTSLTRLVLVNAVYFKARWADELAPEATSPEPFHPLDGPARSVPLMHGRVRAGYAAEDGYRAVRLPYIGGASMLVVAPEPGRFAEVEERFGPAFVASVDAALRPHRVDMRMPRFELTGSFLLSNVLAKLGIRTAFDQDRADFTGITRSEPPLSIGEVVHQAFVRVDETGTEAAGATAVLLRATSSRLTPPLVELTLDRPFLFAIRSDTTGSVLFLGRLLDPGEGGA